jgi:hypothetical protein
MAEWLTYSLGDFLLFSPATFYRLIELYNRAIWPAQILALALGVAILALPRRPGAGRATAALLAAAWLWVAWAFLHERYATINWAADCFAIAFALQALLLAWRGVARGHLEWAPARDPVTRTGLGLFLFALVVQPWLGAVLGGRGLWSVEIAGLAPDPTATATLGLLLATKGRVPWPLLPIPLLWCLVAAATLHAMGAPEAPVPLVVAVLAHGLALWRATRR